MKTASPCKFAAESMLAEYGFSTDATPPYEKRFSGTEIWRGAIKNFYRFPAASDRRDKGVAGLALGGWEGRGAEKPHATYRTQTTAPSLFPPGSTRFLFASTPTY